MDNKSFIQFLKEGKSMAAEKPSDGRGGFLVPDYIDVPADGKAAAAWRLLGRIFSYFGFGRLGVIAHRKGTYPVNTAEFLCGKVRQI